MKSLSCRLGFLILLPRPMSFGLTSASTSWPKLESITWSVMAALQVVRLMKSMRRLCVDPAAAGVEPEPDEEISIDPRKEQEPLHSNLNQSRLLKLKFSNNINGPIFTGLPVGEEGSNLSLDLVDPRTHNIIKSGPEASAKVEIVVLEKEFRSYCQGKWTPGEFKSRIVRSWPGDKSLIRGDPHVTLKDGSVSVSKISLKHTRVHWRKREIRLGARAMHPYNNGTRIMEAVTEPFFVKDRRNMSKSQSPLTLGDEVWKLQGIGKGRTIHDILMKEGIKTVGDFLTRYFLNREKLVNILGRRMHTKKLDATVNLAKSKLEFQRYLYPSAHSQQNQNERVVFTDVGEVIGVLYQEGQFVSVQNLTGTQKDSAMELVKIAFQNRQNVKLLDDDDRSMLCTSTSANAPSPLEATVHDGSNEFSNLEDYCPIDTKQQQGPNAYFMPSTSIIRNCDTINQINSLENLFGEDSAPLTYEDIYQVVPENIWDYHSLNIG